MRKVESFNGGDISLRAWRMGQALLKTVSKLSENRYQCPRTQSYCSKYSSKDNGEDDDKDNNKDDGKDEEFQDKIDVDLDKLIKTLYYKHVTLILL